MAFQMNYTDRYGDNYPESYWRPENWNFTKHTAEVTFVGYPSENKKGGRVIGQHGYVLSVEQYTKYIQSSVGNINTAFDIIASQMYLMAANTSDVELDDSIISFFENAKEV